MSAAEAIAHWRAGAQEALTPFSSEARYDDVGWVTVVSTLEALRMARKLRLLLEEEGVPLRALYLFGSAARGDTRRWSDIDIAVVCSPFAEIPLQEYCAVAKHAYRVDPRISILSFRPEHFENPLSGVVREACPPKPWRRRVKREGISV